MDTADGRRPVLEEVAGAVLGVAGARPVLVGVDGRDGAGKTTFADALGVVLQCDAPVQRISFDDFLAPRAVRHARGRDSPEGFYHDSLDLDTIEEGVLGPVRRGERTIRTAVHDLATDRAVTGATAALDPLGIVVVDGLFLHRFELRGAWDVSVFLRSDPAVTFARMADRDGSDPDPDARSNRRYLEGMALYLRECTPASRATFVVDNDDPGHPVVLSRPGDVSPG